MIKQVMILGPTASGKTALAIELAKNIDAEIISVDSRQCYKKIDIGTAKPTKEILRKVPHYNISHLELDQSDSVADFLVRANQWSRQILDRGKRVIYAGGSTLHLQSLIQPLDDVPESDPGNIRKIEKKINEEGLQPVFQLLEKADPEYAENMDGLNRQRIIRALDVWMQTGKPFSSFHSRKKPEPPEDMIVYGIHWPRKKLHERINKRVDLMFEAGLIGETREILQEGYSPDLQALQTVGYRQVIEFINGEISKEKMIADVKTHTRRYAKRQITWFRKWPFIQWLNAEELDVNAMANKIQHGLAAKLNKT